VAGAAISRRVLLESMSCGTDRRWPWRTIIGRCCKSASPHDVTSPARGRSSRFRHILPPAQPAITGAVRHRMAATDILSGGMPPTPIAALLGRESMHSTARYTQRNECDLRGTVNRLAIAQEQ
jgi:hypothetical protein